EANALQCPFQWYGVPYSSCLSCFKLFACILLFDAHWCTVAVKPKAPYFVVKSEINPIQICSGIEENFRVAPTFIQFIIVKGFSQLLRDIIDSDRFVTSRRI